MQDPERTILEDIRRGDTQKYALLVDRYKERGLALAIRIVRSRQDAEEALQDAFVRAFRGLDNFRGDSSFGTWLYRILYNLCLTRLRGVKNKMDPFDPLDDSLLDTLTSEHVGGEGIPGLEERDMLTLVEAELERLPERYRIPVTMYYQQELSYEEIARVMDAPVGTVKTNLHRARNLLRKNVLDILAREEVAS